MKRVWVVDDEILFLAKVGGIPAPDGLNAEIVKHMLSTKEDWTDPHVWELCSAFCSAADLEATFFVSPQSMLAHLRAGASAPDAIVFDWEYYGSSLQSAGTIKQLLETIPSYLQVYSHLPVATIEQSLDPLRAKHGSRLLSAQLKAEVKPAKLAEDMKVASGRTLGSQVGEMFRSRVRDAIERVLIDLTSVPVDAMSALADGKRDNALNMLVARVREDVGYSQQDIFDDIARGQKGASTSVGPPLRKLISFWYYFFPLDKRVRRGDLIRLLNGEMGLIVTSPCDLGTFRKKTGGRLTWLQVFDTAGLGVELERAGVKWDAMTMARSITSDINGVGGLYVSLPNVPLDAKREGLSDLFVCSHGWRSEQVELEEGEPAAFYDRFYGAERICTLAEPFLSAVCTRVMGVISAPGLPDLPVEESKRLTAVLQSSRPAVQR